MAIKMLVFDFRDSEKEFFKKNDFDLFDITFYPESLNDHTVEGLTPDELEKTNIVSVFTNSRVSENVINKFKNLRIISTRSTGYDQINKKAVMEKNISVINVDTYGSKSVAQFAFALIMALVRNIVPAAISMRDGACECDSFVGRDLSKLTLGIAGTGAIGSSVAQMGATMGMKVLAYDLNLRQELMSSIKVEYVDFSEFLSRSDVISIHMPYTGNNHHMFSDEEFNMMKDNSYFVNTSRGEIVDTNAAYNAMVSGKLAGLALDVVACEDLTFRCVKHVEKLKDFSLECVREVELIKKLVKLNNVIITPHIAYKTQDAIDYILEQTFDGIRDCIKGGRKYRVY